MSRVKTHLAFYGLLKRAVKGYDGESPLPTDLLQIACSPYAYSTLSSSSSTTDVTVAVMLPSVEQYAQETVSQLFDFITAQGDGDYIGEAVSQLEHSLQAAHHAVEAKADEETILGALLHDIGRFIPEADEMDPLIAPDGTFVGRASHEIVGEQYLRQLGFSEKICQLVGAHVMAKRYLTAVDKGYYDDLSQSSKTTLKYQGGIFTPEQVKEAEKDPFLRSKLAVRRWDDLAKIPGMKTYPLGYYRPMATANLISSRSLIELHGREYRLPSQPTVVVCVDGFDPEYLEQGIADGILPNVQALTASGFLATAYCAMPSFTNPNNLSIITGAPTAAHGISGNFFLDRATGKESMIQDDSLLRGSTIPELMSRRGVRVAAVTAKDKLRKIIGHGLSPSSGAICFSAEKANQCSEGENGINNVEKWIGRSAPPQYSGDLSIFVLDAGVKLLEEKKSDLLYLTLSDYIQHHHAPGSKESNEFMSVLDARIGRLVELGAIVAVTGDHGMSQKVTADGKPNVLFLEDLLNTKFGPGLVRVICPITDPFVQHHGALGSFVRVYLKDAAMLYEVLGFCRALPQVEIALEGQAACEKFEMPLDHEGDFVVVAKNNAVIGSREDEHDLSSLEGHELRSHGGLSEEKIPLMCSKPLRDRGAEERRRWRNFDVFDVALNLCSHGEMVNGIA